MGELPLNTFDSMAAAPQDGTILVTGLGPFYGHSVNASWVAVQELARLTVHNPDGTHCKLDIREIPVEYEVVATEVPKLWRDVNPRCASERSTSARGAASLAPKCALYA